MIDPKRQYMLNRMKQMKRMDPLSGLSDMGLGANVTIDQGGIVTSTSYPKEAKPFEVMVRENYSLDPETKRRVWNPLWIWKKPGDESNESTKSAEEKRNRKRERNRQLAERNAIGVCREDEPTSSEGHSQGNASEGEGGT